MIIFAKIIKSIIYKDFILLNVHPASFAEDVRDNPDKISQSRRHSAKSGGFSVCQNSMKEITLNFTSN